MRCFDAVLAVVLKWIAIERYPQGVYGPQYIYLSSHAIASHCRNWQQRRSNDVFLMYSGQISDIMGYTAEHMPRFNSISISGYHMQVGLTGLRKHSQSDFNKRKLVPQAPSNLRSQLLMEL